jgi:acyl-CoA reductase-like NAD-dependent aldehyde dehydrogenase
MDMDLRDDTVAFLASGPKKLLVGERWVEAESGETFATHNPANNQVLAHVAAAGPADVDRAVVAARQALDGPWGRMSGSQRAQIMWRLADLIEEHAAQLAELETLDNGKPYRDSHDFDVPWSARHFRYYAGWADKLEGATVPVSDPEVLVYTVREPMGVVGLIVPWNYPLLMAAWKVAPAMACGNAIILKPAEETPLTALRLGELVMEAGAPPGAFNVLTGFGVPAGSSLASHPAVDKVGFTGSTAVGRKVMGAAAESNLKRVSLELGGKSPHVIFADADLDEAVEKALWGIFANSGQSCTAGSRLYVEQPVLEEVQERLVTQAKGIDVGSGFSPGSELGPLISQQQMQRVMSYIEAGRHEGLSFLTGGERLGGELAAGNFLAPTVFRHEDDKSQLVQEEIFGPVLGLSPFGDWDELVSRVNDTVYGLAAGIWTRDTGKAHRFARTVKAGTVWINTWDLTDPAAPFGGYKQSGFGREMGKDALELYTQVKTVWVSV